MALTIPKEHLEYLQTYLAQPAAGAVFDSSMVEKISEWVLLRTNAPMEGQDASNLVKYALIVTDCNIQSSLRAMIPEMLIETAEKSHRLLRARLDELLTLLGPKH